MTMRLLVGEYKGKGVTCELKLPPLTGGEPPATMPDEPARIRLIEFRGAVEDEKKALIPHVIIRVLRVGSQDHESAAEFLSDENGQFALRLDNGSYVAIFDYQGFRERILAFHLGNDGWQGVELAMIVDGSSVHDPPASEWKGGR